MLKTVLLMMLMLAIQAPAETGQAPLLSFMTEYAQSIVHIGPASDREGAEEVQPDFWKSSGTETGDQEAAEYLRIRGLLDDVGGGRIFFLRALSEAELAEVLHFRMQLEDPDMQDSLDTRFFRFALIRMVAVDADGNVDRAALGLDEEPPVSWQNLRERVAGHLAPTPIDEEEVEE